MGENWWLIWHIHISTYSTWCCLESLFWHCIWIIKNNNNCIRQNLIVLNHTDNSEFWRLVGYIRAQICLFEYLPKVWICLLNLCSGKDCSSVDVSICVWQLFLLWRTGWQTVGGDQFHPSQHFKCLDRHAWENSS